MGGDEGWGEVEERGPWRAGRWGEMGTREQCGSNKRKKALIWLGDEAGGMGGRRGEVAHGGRARDQMGGGSREQCGSNKRCTGNNFGLFNEWRRGEVAHGGRAPESRWWEQQRAVWEQLFFFFELP